MKRLLLAATLAMCGPAYAQQHFVLRGHADNFKEDFFEIGHSTMFDFQPKGIPVDAKGNFQLVMPITGMQDLGIILKDSMFRQFVLPGDTLTMTWDNNRLNASLKIKSNVPSRQQEIDLMRRLDTMTYRYIAMEQGYYRTMPSDTAIAAQITALYNQELKIIFSSPFTPNTDKIITDKYYQYLTAQKRKASIDKFPLVADPALADEDFKRSYLPPPNAHKTPSERALLVSSTYRNYLDDVVRMERVLNNGISYSDSRYTSPGFLPFNPAMRDFHNAMATFDLAALRDWAAVNALMVAYRNEPFDRVDAVYALFMKEAIVPEYRDSLIAFRQRMLRVKPGVKAPAISLKDEKGKLVSLDDFKGKLVYLDFWGVYCGPCIGDIEGYAAKIHARYKDKPVVFVTICADAKPEKWKETLAKYKMDGVNLHAADGRRSDVLDNYGVNGIPHYFLIDENGIILDNNAPRLSELDRTENNTLDKALGKLTASK